MIFGIPIDSLVPFLNLLGIGFLGIVAAFGVWFGRKGAADAGATVEVAGALVSGQSVGRLVAAIEAHTLELTAARHDREKERQATYRFIEVINLLAGELEEHRRVVADMANQIARMK